MTRTTSLEDVLITDELPFRPPHVGTYEAVTKAILNVSESIAGQRRDVLSKLCGYAMELCRADSAGISVLEEVDGTKQFRWPAIAGLFAGNVGETTPYDGPCGIVVDIGKPQLFRLPERFFTYGVPVDPPLEEALLVPLLLYDDLPAGTIWVIAHTPDHKFDATDVTILEDLSQFASSAYRTLRLLDSR